MAADEGLVDWVAEAMEPIGRVTRRAMMGGATLYCDGTIFAVVDEEALYFKADEVSAPTFEAAGCPPFTFQSKAGEVVALSYRQAPDDVYDDADALREWAALGIAAGLRAPSKRKRQ